MKKQIINVSVFQNAKVAAAMYFVISIPFVVIMILATMATGQSAGPGIMFMIFLPVFYVIFGFIFTAIAAWLYNLVAARVGGLEFTTIEIDK